MMVEHEEKIKLELHLWRSTMILSARVT